MTVSLRHCGVWPAVLACGVVALGASAPVRAMPQTVAYHCKPAWPEGDTLTLDWNSGHKSITATFPNGSEMTMAIEKSGPKFVYGEADTEISGTNQHRVVVTEGGEPARTCVADE
jgi:hypothetical protein